MKKKQGAVVLEGNQAFLDAFCMGTFGGSIVEIDRQIASVAEDNPNKAELMRVRAKVNDALERGDLTALEDRLEYLILATRNAVRVMPMATAYHRQQQAAGKARGKQQAREKKKRTRDRGAVSRIIKELANLRDGWGDYRSNRELWPELFSYLDCEGTNPQEINATSGKPLKITYTATSGKNDEITYASFKAMVSTARKTVK